MNWQMLMYFLRRVVPSGEVEANELLKLYETAKLYAERESKESAA
jgi:hypothetical protein